MKIIADISLRDIDKLFSILEGFDDFSVKYLETNNIKHEFIYDADILLVRSQTLINERLLSSSNIKWIGSATAGVDHIDIKFLESKNINWFNAQGCNAYSVCNYVLSSLYELKKDKIYNLNIGVNNRTVDGTNGSFSPYVGFGTYWKIKVKK